MLLWCNPSFAEKIKLNCKLTPSSTVDMQKEYNMTSVLISHETRTIFEVAERVIMLDNGKVVYNGGTNKIKDIETPIIKQFFTGNSEIELGAIS